MSAPFEYCLFGLTVRSEIELPELPPLHLVGQPDIQVEITSVKMSGACEDDYWVSDDGAGFVIDEVGAYWISQGRHIAVDPHPGAPIRNVRLYLLGSAMGILLHQRGLLPLHASAIEIEGRAFAFLGRSGAGKSTLAAAFHDRGYRVIADDVSVVGYNELGRPVVNPGIPRLRLWEEALLASGRSSSDYGLSYAGDENFRKFDVPLIAAPAPTELAAIYQLTDGQSFAFRRLEGAAAAEALFANTYRGEFIRHGGDAAAHWSASTSLVTSVPIFQLVRPRDLHRVMSDMETIARHASALTDG